MRILFNLLEGILWFFVSKLCEVLLMVSLPGDILSFGRESERSYIYLDIFHFPSPIGAQTQYNFFDVNDGRGSSWRNISTTNCMGYNVTLYLDFWLAGIFWNILELFYCLVLRFRFLWYSSVVTKKSRNPWRRVRKKYPKVLPESQNLAKIAL